MNCVPVLRQRVGHTVPVSGGRFCPGTGGVLHCDNCRTAAGGLAVLPENEGAGAAAVAERRWGNGHEKGGPGVGSQPDCGRLFGRDFGGSPPDRRAAAGRGGPGAWSAGSAGAPCTGVYQRSEGERRQSVKRAEAPAQKRAGTSVFVTPPSSAGGPDWRPAPAPPRWCTPRRSGSCSWHWPPRCR